MARRARRRESPARRRWWTNPAGYATWCWSGTPGSGKTTLVEALLAATGTIPRAGSVTEGTTVCDHDPAAVKQQRSVSLACAPVVHDGIKINLLDTPGYADFVGELRAGLRAADAALFVVLRRRRHGRGDGRAVGGVRRASACRGRWRSPGWTTSVPTSTSTLAECRRVFGDNVLPLYLPMLGDDGVSRSPD